MANPYHDEFGQFCSRDEMKGAVTRIRQQAVDVAIKSGGYTPSYEALKQQADSLDQEFDKIELQRADEVKTELLFQRILASANKGDGYSYMYDLVRRAKTDEDVDKIINDSNLLKPAPEGKERDRDRALLELLQVEGLTESYNIGRIWKALGNKIPNTGFFSNDFSDDLAKNANKTVQEIIAAKALDSEDVFSKYAGARLLAKSKEFSPEEAISKLDSDPEGFELMVYVSNSRELFGDKDPKRAYVLEHPELQDALYHQVRSFEANWKKNPQSEESNLLNSPAYESARFLASESNQQDILVALHKNDLTSAEYFTWNKNLTPEFTESLVSGMRSDLDKGKRVESSGYGPQGLSSYRSLASTGKIKKLEPVYYTNKEDSKKAELRLEELREKDASLQEMRSYYSGRGMKHELRYKNGITDDEIQSLRQEISNAEADVASYVDQRKKLERKLTTLKAKPQPKTSKGESTLWNKRQAIESQLQRAELALRFKAYNETPISELVIR